MRQRESKAFRGIRFINDLQMQIVQILYRERDFDAFGDFGDFVESVSCGTTRTCQVRVSNPSRGATVQPAGPRRMQLSNAGSPPLPGVPMTRRATRFDFARQVRCYNVAYENDVCPRFA